MTSLNQEREDAAYLADQLGGDDTLDLDTPIAERAKEVREKGFVGRWQGARGAKYTRHFYPPWTEAQQQAAIVAPRELLPAAVRRGMGWRTRV